MAEYEYRVVAAPRRTRAYKGVRTHEDQFAAVLAEIMNDMARDDWEYLRAESLPCEEKTGITSRVVAYQNMLVFRRKLVANQQFFAVPVDKRLEHHPVAEDANAAEMASAAPAAGPVATGPSVSSEARTGSKSILSILRERRARAGLSDPDHPANRLAAE